MADANGHDPAELHPEDAPSEVQPFDEDPDDRNERQSSEGDNSLHPEDAPSEVQLFEEEPEERARPRLRQAAGGRNPPIRGPRGRAQSPQARDFGAEENARPRPSYLERRDERRRKRDGYARSVPRTPSFWDEVRPDRPQARHFRAVERIRKKVYRVPKERAGEPIDEGHYRWYVREYSREHSREPKKRRIIVEGGPERIDVFFDESTPNSNIHTWVAEKILELKGRGPAAPLPSEMREPIYDNGLCCSILSQSTTSLPFRSACKDTNLNFNFTSAGYPSDGLTLEQSLAPRLRLRAGAGSRAGASESSASPLQPFAITSDEDNDEKGNESKAKNKWKGKERESSQSPVQSSDNISNDDHDEHSSPSRSQRENMRRKTKKHVRPRSSSHQTRQPEVGTSNDSVNDRNLHYRPSRGHPRKRLQRTEKAVQPRSSSYRSHLPEVRSPSGEGSQTLTADETLVEDRESRTSGNRHGSRSQRRGDPYRLKRIQGRRTAIHDEERANLSDPDNIIAHICRDAKRKHRTKIWVEGIEDDFSTSRRDNDMSGEEIMEHVVAAIEQSWAHLGRKPRARSPSPPGCRCVIF